MIGGALVLHVVFIALLVRRALRLPRPAAAREPVGAWVWVPVVVGLLPLVVIVLAALAGDALAQRVL